MQSVGREADDTSCTVRTLRQFIAATNDLGAVIRAFMLPKQDKK